MATRRQLRIAENVVLSRPRKLALPGEVLVSRYQEVNPETVVARTEMVPGDPWVVDIFSDMNLRLTPQQARRAIVRRVGERVETHDVLAEHRLPGLLGERRTVRSPVAGVIEFISYVYGRVLIREDARRAQPQVVVDLARQLDVWPMTIGMYLQCREGDEVRQGAVLAAAPSGIGLQYAYAPVSGVIERVDLRTGSVVITRQARPAEVESYLKGRVQELVADYGAVVSTRADHVLGVFGLGFENYGTLRVPVDSPAAELTADALTPEHAGCVLVAGAYAGLRALRRAAGLGVRGVIVGGADHLDLEHLAGKEIGVGISGQEDLALTVVMTEGFGRMEMNRDLFDLLRASEGAVVSLNGTTQVRAGVVRPEIVIHRGLPEPGDPPTPLPRALGPVVELAPGTCVRLLRGPYLGLWGRVVSAGNLAELETEVRVPVAEVELADGRRVMVPEANLEVY